jgi:hypothetical protein
MPMTTITLYSTTNPDKGRANDYTKLLTSAGPVFIRAYVRTGPHNDLLAALDHADPAGHEVVLNTIEAPDQSNATALQEA